MMPSRLPCTPNINSEKDRERPRVGACQCIRSYLYLPALFLTLKWKNINQKDFYKSTKKYLTSVGRIAGNIFD